MVGVCDTEPGRGDRGMANEMTCTQSVGTSGIGAIGASMRSAFQANRQVLQGACNAQRALSNAWRK